MEESEREAAGGGWDSARGGSRGAADPASLRRVKFLAHHTRLPISFSISIKIPRWYVLKSICNSQYAKASTQVSPAKRARADSNAPVPARQQQDSDAVRSLPPSSPPAGFTSEASDVDEVVDDLNLFGTASEGGGPSEGEDDGEDVSWPLPYIHL